MLNFFGLGSEYRPVLHSEIFDLVFHSKGSLDWGSVYFDMPVWLRHFYIKKLDEYNKKRNKQIEDANKGSSGKSINKPGIH